MNKKIKVIDLLNMIANGEEIPEKIWIKGRMFEKYLNHNTYIDEEDNYFLDMTRNYINDKDFYNEEIIEESKKIEYTPIIKEDEIIEINLAINQTRRKLNEIIDKLNEMEK